VHQAPTAANLARWNSQSLANLPSDWIDTTPVSFSLHLFCNTAIIPLPCWVCNRGLGTWDWARPACRRPRSGH